jgi:hypothetical protein
MAKVIVVPPRFLGQLAPPPGTLAVDAAAAVWFGPVTLRPRKRLQEPFLGAKEELDILD